MIVRVFLHLSLGLFFFVLKSIFYNMNVSCTALLLHYILYDKLYLNGLLPITHKHDLFESP